MVENSWIHIPRGFVTLLKGGYLSEAMSFDVAPFAIARYPVTNEQYSEFISDGGYTNHAWWSEAGWTIRKREMWGEPRYWDSRDWNQPGCPTVGVSWYEAMAFCNWLSAVSGHTILLPTEQQWQRAAQGDDERVFPWGNEEPNEFVCNWNRNVDETTPVSQYPNGASPFAVMDMCGNVWEWCLTSWHSGRTEINGREPRLLRGGSWSSDSPLSLQVSNRRDHDPNTKLEPYYRNDVTVGFRCVRLPC